MVDEPDGPARGLDPLTEQMAGGVSDLLEHIPATIFIVTDEERPRHLYVNGQVERLSGHGPNAWLDDPDLWMRSIHPDDRERVQARWTASVQQGLSFLCEYRIVRPDGSTVWVREATDPVPGEDGTV